MQQQKSLGFGMALHMDEAKIKKALKKYGKYAAEQAKAARPELEEMAKDVDIFVAPVGVFRNDPEYLDIIIEDRSPQVPKLTKFVDLVKRLTREKRTDNKPYTRTQAFPVAGFLREQLTEKAATAKQDFFFKTYRLIN